MKEKVYFENSKGDKLCGIISDPSSDKVRPIVILSHGLSSSKDSRTYLGLEKILNNHKISTFRFDFFGHGESEGKFEDITISEAVDDILKAIEFLKELRYSKIGLFGSSFGGLASIIAASKRKDLFVLVLKSPVSNYLGKIIAKESKEEMETWKERGFIYYLAGDGQRQKLNYSFFKGAEKVNGYEIAEKINLPTLIVHGDRDEIVPIEQSKKLAGLIKNCKLEIIKGADHRYSAPEYFKKMLNLISKFIIKNSERY
jgi:hypothetical protein